MSFTQEKLRAHPSLRNDQKFYEERFKPEFPISENEKIMMYPLVDYSEMNSETRQKFKQFLKDHYYQFLGLTDFVENNPEFLEYLEKNTEFYASLSNWIREQQRISYYSQLENEIVNAHRALSEEQKKGFQEIRTMNRKIIHDFSKMQEDLIQIIQNQIDRLKQMYNPLQEIVPPPRHRFS